MSSICIQRHIDAPRANVYRALLEARAVAVWIAPVGMKSEVHIYEPAEGGAIRISLIYDAPTSAGDTSAQVDTYRGHFVKLVPDEQVTEVVEFESNNAALQGEMTITISLSDVDGGTDIQVVHDNLPRGLSLADNEMGWQRSLANLASLVEMSGASG